MIKTKLCTQKVQARCTTHQRTSSTKGGTVYTGRFSYTVDRQKYTAMADESYWHEKKQKQDMR